jgi:hypothetical protein
MNWKYQQQEFADLKITERIWFWAFVVQTIAFYIFTQLIYP